MGTVIRLVKDWFLSWHLSLFEKVILVNSVMLIVEALSGLWVTSHHLEVQHYLIDTIFIIAAALFILFANILLLRASFRPLFQLLTTIREISIGNRQARAEVSQASWEVGELAQAFNKMLDRLEMTRREQTMHILQAQEEERKRIGIELHDEAGQNLTALLIHAEILNQRFQQLPTLEQATALQQQLGTELQQMTKLTQTTLESIRVLAQQLRPSVLDDLGLLAAFRWLVEDAGQRLHLHVTLETHDVQTALPLMSSMHETALFRIAQESLTNVARHAQTQHVAICLQHKADHMLLQIHDDGCGYDIARQKAGTGIIGMRERASALGGTLHIDSAVGLGTTIHATLPLHDQHRPATINSTGSTTRSE